MDWALSTAVRAVSDVEMLQHPSPHLLFADPQAEPAQRQCQAVRPVHVRRQQSHQNMHGFATDTDEWIVYGGWCSCVMGM